MKLINADDLPITAIEGDYIGMGMYEKTYAVLKSDIEKAPTVDAIPISFIKDCITKGDDWTFDKDTLWHLIERWENNVAKI